MDALTRFISWLLKVFATKPPPRAPVSVPRAKTSPAGISTPNSPVDVMAAFSDAAVLARTIWAEARGQGATGMQAVCNVIQNRAATPGWWGATLRDVCLDHITEKSGRVVYQFSCWSTDDPQAARMRAPSIGDASYSVAYSLALRAVSGRLPDITHGADHYYAEYIPTPKWAIGKTPTFVLGPAGDRQFFYKLGLAS